MAKNLYSLSISFSFWLPDIFVHGKVIFPTDLVIIPSMTWLLLGIVLAIPEVRSLICNPLYLVLSTRPKSCQGYRHVFIVFKFQSFFTKSAKIRLTWCWFGVVTLAMFLGFYRKQITKPAFSSSPPVGISAHGWSGVFGAWLDGPGAEKGGLVGGPPQQGK